MATPLSLSPSPLTSLGDHSHKKLFDDDFSVNKLNLKAKGPTVNGGTTNYKGTLDLSRGLAPSQETKFQFPYKSYYLWFATRPEQTKVHVDLGEFNIVKKQNLFANAVFYNSSVKSTLRLGAVYKGTHCLSHTRLEWKNQDRWNLLVRSQITHNKFVYTIADEISLDSRNQLSITKGDFLLGYLEKDYDVYLRHLTLNQPNYPLFAGFGVGRVLLNLVYRKNQHQFGVEADFQKVGKYGFTLAASTKKNDIDIKGKLNVIDQVLGLSFKGKFNKTFGYAVATQVPVNGKPPKACGVFPLPIGITLETTM